MDKKALIEALRRELDGYIRRGMATRADAVRTELTRLGCSLEEIPSEVVPSEAGSTPQKPATRARKAVEPIEEPPAPKTPQKRKRAK